MPPQFVIFFSLISCTIIAGFFRFRQLTVADKIIILLVGLSGLAELLAYIAMKRWHNNLLVYHLYSPFELLLISLYFHRTVAALKRTKFALFAALIAIPTAILNALYFQDPATTPNSYFVLLEGTFIIIFALLSFFQILMHEERLPIHSAQFWITSSLIVFWSLTYMGWGIYTVLNKPSSPLSDFFQQLLIIACYLQYFGIACTFTLYKKLVPSGA
jgi:hypothetical protein